MVVQSGVFPYQYHTNSWADSDTGKFRIPGGQVVQPSAIHFEETMYVLKAEHNRVVNKQSGYKTVAGSPPWFFTLQGVFYGWLNNGQSGSYDPNPSGAHLDGTLGVIDYFSNFGASFSYDKPAAVHQKAYIEHAREVADFIISHYAQDGGGWAIIGNNEEDESGVRRDWLEIYKDYNDFWSTSGLWFQGGSRFVDASEDFLSSGLIFDRHLDEVRLQPIPYFGLSNDISMIDIDFHAPWGNPLKMNSHYWGAIRPRYMLTDGTLPSGWASGLEVGRNNLSSGIAGHLIDGTTVTLSGGGNGLDSNIYLISGVWGGPLDNDTYPSSPSYARWTSLDPSGVDNMVSGQYRVFLAHGTDSASFPWGTGLGAGARPHRSAQWPFEGGYEPIDGIQETVLGDYFDTQYENSSFWVIDHVFAIVNDRGGSYGQSPHMNSGIYWFQLNGGPSNAISVIDAWPIHSDDSKGLVGGVQYHSGIWTFWGKIKDEGYRSQYATGGLITQWIFGEGWDYDRTNDDYVKVGASGTSAGLSSSGIYVTYNQQMVYLSAGVMPAATFGGDKRWHVYEALKNVEDGTHTWLLYCLAASGEDADLTNAVSNGCWLRTNSSWTIQDGVVDIAYWPAYLRSRSEYIGLINETASAIPKAGDIAGDNNAEYKLVTPTWGTLGSIDATGSGSYTTTSYNLTYAGAVSGILNVSNSTAKDRIHIGCFFETEPDNDVYCTLMAFGAGEASGTTNTPDFWIAKLDSSSHPFEVTDAWRIGSAGTFYSNAVAGLNVADADIANCAHFRIHENG